MTNPVIVFDNVSKSFQIWRDRPISIKSILAQLITFRLDLGKKSATEVIQNCSMKIYPGEFVGVMGRNGVGKSTILKLISGIYFPTTGDIKVEGRVIPLLELGAGFAPELTGYENIFLNGSILGISRQEVLEKVDDIVAFSELGEHINKIVRNYSSGMLVRLGFSIAAHLNASVLLFDEVLAVGDVGFQTKCYQMIKRLHAQGRTIVLVTHSPEQIENFCSRCIVLESKGVVFDGDPKKGADVYRGFFGAT